MANKTSYKNIEGLVELKGNGGKIIGVKNNRLVATDIDEIFKTFNVSEKKPFCLNSCGDNLFTSYGIESNGDYLTLNPMTLRDSTDTIDIVIDKNIVKSINGLFEEGENKGCKDESYTKWNQPIINEENTVFGRCYQTLGTNTQKPHLALDSIYYSANNCWLSSTVSANWIFESTIPMIIDSIVIVNTQVANRTRTIDIYADLEKNKILQKNCFLSPDVNDQNYISIDNDAKVESNVLHIETLSTFSGTTTGFQEIIINAKTKYIQQNEEYNVFVITDENQEKIDVLLSSYDKPILPEGFKYYAYVQKVRTQEYNFKFDEVYGDELKFNVSEYPMIITNAKNETAILYDINNIKFKDEINDKIVKHTIYVSLDGKAYSRTQTYFKNRTEFPKKFIKGTVVSIINNAMIEAYEYDGKKWVEFNDVPIGEIYRYNDITISMNQYSCNNNFVNKGSESTLWIAERLAHKNQILAIPHNLDIEDTTDYKFDCILVNVVPEFGYLEGDTAMCSSLTIDTANDMRNIQPYLTKDYIGLNIFNVEAGFRVIHKTRGLSCVISPEKWKLVFRIWR